MPSPAWKYVKIVHGKRSGKFRVRARTTGKLLDEAATREEAETLARRVETLLDQWHSLDKPGDPPLFLNAAIDARASHLVETSPGKLALRRKGHRRGPPLKELPIERALREAEQRFLKERDGAPTIPARHLDVMRLSAEGYTNAEIAERTGYTIRQINNVRAKYGRK